MPNCKENNEECGPMLECVGAKVSIRTNNSVTMGCTDRASIAKLLDSFRLLIKAAALTFECHTFLLRLQFHEIKTEKDSDIPRIPHICLSSPSHLLAKLPGERAICWLHASSEVVCSFKKLKSC
ncbi:hypothetical protein NE237_021771 [Protea cynaroides]|uniref:Uncharacterized protein n=1 Tax=Protea cynaroides TaxID=273540 RepID=A0A9Q0K3K9_9MAGN|nr:hypothetical protein NE237_021771 [Protea cynaroides]